MVLILEYNKCWKDSCLFLDRRYYVHASVQVAQWAAAVSCRLSSGGQEPEARGSELVPTFCTTKGMETCVTARWLGTPSIKGKETLSDCGVSTGSEAGHPLAHWSCPLPRRFRPSSGGLKVTAGEASGWPGRKVSLTYKINCRNTAVFIFIEYLITHIWFLFEDTNIKSIFWTNRTL